MVFGYYAAAIAATFFPNNIPFASLMMTLMTFGAGFPMRPLGALILLTAYLRYIFDAPKKKVLQHIVVLHYPERQ